MKINTKAFTLIELLAVIVILAIIALIATPIVLNIIANTKESSQLRSAEMYLDAVEQAVMREKMTNTSFKPNKCEIKNKKLYCNESTEELVVEVDGEKPDNGYITFSNGKVTFISLEYGNKKVGKDNEGNIDYKVCTVIADNDSDGKITTGDEIECAKEGFYVIDNDGTTISMLAKYNLNVGSNTYADGTIGTQNENVVGAKSGMTTYGNIAFSTSNYWYDTTNSTYKTGYIQGESGKYYVYDNNSNLYDYVENYETYLKGKGASSASATLISYDKLLDLINNKGNPSWLYNTSYWSGSANSSDFVWFVPSNSSLVNNFYGIDSDFGVRPVVNISVNEI